MWGSNPSPFREKFRVVDCCIRDEVYAAMWKKSWVAWFVDRRRLKSIFRTREWEPAHYGLLPSFVWL